MMFTKRYEPVRDARSVTIRKRFAFLSLLFFTACSTQEPVPVSGPTVSPMPVVAKYVQEHGALSSPIIDPYIQDTLKRITAALPHPIATKFSVSILDTGNPIAFTPGGGFILISVGLIDHLKREGEFIFVLAHEIAHEVLGHTASESFYSKDPAARQALEYQADQLAAEIVSRLGYDPALSLSALKDGYEGLSEEQYSTVYPTQEARTDALVHFLASMPPPSTEIDESVYKKFRRAL